MDRFVLWVGQKGFVPTKLKEEIPSDGPGCLGVLDTLWSFIGGGGSGSGIYWGATPVRPGVSKVRQE